ncbi:MAG TPA: DUF881 domain-containing protein, partial [Armatimonadota bacterium]|nr:DUF881 domain-containing protein [Armatimonadota bacterium]
GLMLALAIRTTDRIQNSGLETNRHGTSAADLSRFKAQNEELQKEIRQLEQRRDEYRAHARNGRSTSEERGKELQEYKALIGLAPMGGPGLRITLRNCPLPVQAGTTPAEYLVVDQDVNGIVNELWAAGAEGIAIGGADGRFERMILRTTIQGVGRNVSVNGQILSAPYTILAIGNPKELQAALEMPEGIVKVRYMDVLKMIDVKEAKGLVLPAYRSARGGGNRAPAGQ